MTEEAKPDGIAIIQTKTTEAKRFFHVYGRRSADFAILSRDFPIIGVDGGPKAEADAIRYIGMLRNMRFDEISAEFRVHTPISFGGKLP